MRCLSSFVSRQLPLSPAGSPLLWPSRSFSSSPWPGSRCKSPTWQSLRPFIGPGKESPKARGSYSKSAQPHPSAALEDVLRGQGFVNAPSQRALGGYSAGFIGFVCVNITPSPRHHHHYPQWLGVISETLSIERQSCRKQEVARRDTPAIGWLPIRTWVETPGYRGQGVEDNCQLLRLL